MLAPMYMHMHIYMHKNLKIYVLQCQFAKDSQEAELVWVLGFTCYCKVSGMASGLKAN